MDRLPAVGLGTLLRRLLDLLDGDVQRAYDELGLDYRPRYTPVVVALLDLGPSSIRTSRKPHASRTRPPADRGANGRKGPCPCRTRARPHRVVHVGRKLEPCCRRFVANGRLPPPRRLRSMRNCQGAWRRCDGIDRRPGTRSLQNTDTNGRAREACADVTGGSRCQADWNGFGPAAGDGGAVGSRGPRTDAAHDCRSQKPCSWDRRSHRKPLRHRGHCTGPCRPASPRRDSRPLARPVGSGGVRDCPHRAPAIGIRRRSPRPELPCNPIGRRSGRGRTDLYGRGDGALVR